MANQPIKLYDSEGIINGYSPFIVRPFDTVMVPTDVRYGSDNLNCRWPVYAGSKFQKWCSEDNAIKYHQMRPLLTPEDYNSLIAKMFLLIVEGSNKEHGYNHTINLSDITYQTVFCGIDTNTIMKFIMTKVAEAVQVMPEMKKNGPWVTEQFHWTDAEVYQGADKSRQIYYKVLFNLYNPLRSTSTQVEATMKLAPKGLIIVAMNFVNEGDWKATGMTVDGIKSYNDPGQVSNTELKMGPNAMDIEWNYMNTLQKNEFNKYGFYEPGNNVKLNVGIPKNLDKQITYWENNAHSYLLPGTTPRFDGVIPAGAKDGGFVKVNNDWHRPRHVSTGSLVTRGDYKAGNATNFGIIKTN